MSINRRSQCRRMRMSVNRRSQSRRTTTSNTRRSQSRRLINDVNHGRSESRRSIINANHHGRSKAHRPIVYAYVAEIHFCQTNCKTCGCQTVTTSTVSNRCLPDIHQLCARMRRGRRSVKVGGCIQDQKSAYKTCACIQY